MDGELRRIVKSLYLQLRDAGDRLPPTFVAMKHLARLLFPVFAASLLAQTAPAPLGTFPQVVKPFLENHCQSCHNAKVQSGDINFEVLKYSTSLASQATIWETAAYVLKMDQMPPPGSPRPPKDQVEPVIAVIERDLAKARESKASKASAPTREWLTWQGDPERTGWAKAETTLSKANVS